MNVYYVFRCTSTVSSPLYMSSIIIAVSQPRLSALLPRNPLVYFCGRLLACTAFGKKKTTIKKKKNVLERPPRGGQKGSARWLRDDSSYQSGSCCGGHGDVCSSLPITATALRCSRPMTTQIGNPIRVTCCDGCGQFGQGPVSPQRLQSKRCLATSAWPFKALSVCKVL